MLVAVMDVLGVKNMVRNCSVRELELAAESFSSALGRAKTMLREEFARVASPNVISSLSFHWDRFSIKSFSDTLVVVLPIDEQIVDYRDFAIDLFMGEVSFSVYELFYAGFPVRCGIDFGHVILQDDFVLGRAFLGAYDLSERIQCVGAVLTKEAAAVRATARIPLQSGPAYDVLIPVKDGRDELMLCLDWTIDAEKRLLNCRDIRQEVYNAFRAYHKTIDSAVMMKLDNTERVLREFVFRQSNRCF